MQTLLDHGYIKLIEIWGSDERIIEAARMSTNKGFKGWGPFLCSCVTSKEQPDDPNGQVWDTIDNQHLLIRCPKCKGTGQLPGDEKLLSYLYSHKHMTPFEMAGMVIELEAPIMVLREWERHRTQSYNEMSARYTPLPDKNYLPTVERCLIVNSNNKQAGNVPGSEELTHGKALDWLTALSSVYEHAEEVYQMGLKMGIPKELARLPVPVGRYTRLRASANLRNWFAFLTLRMAPEAQWEIRQYANEVSGLITQHFPRTHHLFVEGA